MNDLEYMQGEQCKIELAKETNENIKAFEIPEHLYQYRAFSKWSVENLINKRLTLSNPNTFNDIYDSYLHDNSIESIKKEIKTLKMLIPDFNYDITEKIISDRKGLDAYRSEKMLETFRISCLSKKPLDIKMWGLYAENNRGMCIEYNFKKANTQIQHLLFPVFYRSKPISVNELCYRNRIMQAMLISVIVKNNIWKYENEWRLIFPLDYGIDIE